MAGAALLLVGGLGETRTWGPQGVLSLRPVRAVGDWSYSFYLWHWPLLVVAGAAYGSISGWRGAAVLALALGLAAATYRLVETPFRTSRVLTRARRGRMRSLLLYPAMVVVVLPTVAAADHAVRSDLDGGGAAISTSQFGQQQGDPRPVLGKDQYVALVRASVMAARNGLDVPAGSSTRTRSSCGRASPTSATATTTGCRSTTTCRCARAATSTPTAPWC